MRKKILPLFVVLAATLVFVFSLSSAAAIDNPTDLQQAINNPSGPPSIALTGDIYLSSTLTIPVGREVTLTGDHSLFGPRGAATITVNGKLTLDGITVTHESGSTGNGVIVNAGGAFILESGAISGNTTPASHGGGGVYMNGKGGAAIFTMNGGTISGNTATSGTANQGGGGGVYVFGNGGTATFTMSGGTISGNIASPDGTANGGGVYVNGSIVNSIVAFTMSGGTITGNTAKDGGGVFNQVATFTMSGNAQIVDNKVVRNNANVKGNGGGVYNSNGRFIMNSGTISGNTAATIGGGVRNHGTSASFDMYGGEITGNTSKGEFESSGGGGGGVMNINGATFTLWDGIISGNGASAFNGGGVANKASTFVMKGGEISGNTATNGGGVLNWDSGTFTMTDGKITGNIAANDGGGVWTDNLANLTVEARALFSDNSARAAFMTRNPTDDEVYAQRIFGTQWTAPLTQGYNNYDINYEYEDGRIIYTVTYDGNGHTGGSAPIDPEQYNPNESVTVLGQNDLEGTGYTFLGWSVSQTATSAEYKEGDTFKIARNTTLYAVWQSGDGIDDPGDNGEDDLDTIDDPSATPRPPTELPKMGDGFPTAALLSLLGVAVVAVAVLAWVAIRARKTENE